MGVHTELEHKFTLDKKIQQQRGNFAFLFLNFVALILHKNDLANQKLTQITIKQ